MQNVLKTDVFGYPVANATYDSDTSSDFEELRAKIFLWNRAPEEARSHRKY